jgi:hypothetical protein
MNLPEILKSAKKYHSDQEIIQMTADQLIKDMGDFSIPIQFKARRQGDKETPYRELFDQVEPVIYTLEMMQPEKLKSLLYRIDISENEIKKHISSANPNSASNKTDLSSFITDLVLQRELQKVLTRIYFSSPERLV